MVQKNSGFKPIEVPRPDNKIYKTGYYISEITKADYQVNVGKEMIKIEFEVSRGRCKGFKVSSLFYYDSMGFRRLGHLCNAVGVPYRIDRLDRFLGKLVKLRVVPTRDETTGWLKGYQIIRFLPVNKNQFGKKRSPAKKLVKKLIKTNKYG